MSDGLKSSRSRVGNLEIVIAITGLGALLLANVLFDRFIRYIATGRYEVAAGPQVSTPILFLHMLELHHQFSRSLAFDALHDLAWRQARRAAQQDMHVVRRYGTLQYLNVVRAADLPDQIPNADANRTGQNRLAVLRHPHKVVFDIVAAMRAAAAVFHPSNRRTLRFRLKARVLNPSSGQ